ncbi:D-arabinono-1,4-lactone oxidase [Lysobacter korlensis]|uniref:D-arabinono-1,4-lactone oxidase n=1 Tax=Lysobacter korlensis TaxID=553636 RepID=A0ABV6RMQ5_9GAMM
MPEENWAGNLTYRARAVHHPGSIEEVQSLVAGSDSIRGLGSRHSFSDIADTTGELIVLDRLDPDVRIDPAARTVTASAGLRYGDLATALHAEGWALGNLASLPHISIAGTVATGTHGSGVGSRSLAAAVAALELVSADGELRWIRRGDADFDGAVVSLGALGIVTRMTLDIVPAYDVWQTVYVGLAWSTAIDHLDELLGSAYSVSLFTNWADADIRQVWRKSTADDAPAELFGAAPAVGQQHPVPDAPTEFTTAQGGAPGPWHERLPHFRLEFTPSAGEELQSEYVIPRRFAAEAITAMRELGPRVAHAIQISEVRTFAADSLWLSGAEGTDVIAFHFTWRKDPDLVLPLLPRLEATLAPFSARPHWGKLFAGTGEQVRSLYPRFADFSALRDRLDPQRKFDNDFLRRIVDRGVRRW